MAETYYEEWRTANAQRQYPFSDRCGMTGTNGTVLLPDAFVDAMFYPPALAGYLYLSGISLDDTSVTVSDSASGAVVGEAAIVPGEDVLQFFDAQGRCVGVLVAGPGLGRYLDNIEFLPDQTEFASGCVKPASTGFVSGMSAEGTPGRISGHVVLAGEHGVRITSEYLGVEPVIRIDAIGEEQPAECFGLPPPIKCIQVAQTAGFGALTISRTGNVIALDTPYDLAAFCAYFPTVPDAEGSLPLDGDACVPPPPPEDCPHGAVSDTCTPGQYDEYFIVAVKDTIGIDMLKDTQLDPAAGVLAYLDSSAPQKLPPRPIFGLSLFMKGASYDQQS